MARELLNMATDQDVSDSVKLAAIRDALDRGGVVSKTAVDVGVSVKPYETIFEMEMQSGSRAEFRRSMGTEDDSDSIALPSADADLIVDAEVYEADDVGLGDDLVVDGELVDPTTPDDRELRSPFDLGPNPFTRTPPPEAQLMPFDAAVSAAAEMRRNAVSRPAQRALPRGRS
jgi:hypothetical protein